MSLSLSPSLLSPPPLSLSPPLSSSLPLSLSPLSLPLLSPSLTLSSLSLPHTLLTLSSLPLQNQYEKHKEVNTAQGVKILGKDLEKTLAGLPLLVAHSEDEIPVLRVSPLKAPQGPLRPRSRSLKAPLKAPLKAR